MEKDPFSTRPLLGHEHQYADDDTETARVTAHRCRACSRHRWSWAGQILLFFVSATLFLHSRLGSSVTIPSANSERCVEQLSAYSPALASVSDTYSDMRFNGTVLGETDMKGPPTPERLERWESQVATSTFRLSADEVARIGADVETAAQYPPELGGGYIGWLETYHHLHCLQHLWSNTYNIDYAQARNHSSAHRQHLDHCADLLRQKFLCDADVTVVTFAWVKHLDHYTPNFNTRHKCRNEPQIRSWLEDHHVDRKGMTLTKPKDAVVFDGFP